MRENGSITPGAESFTHTVVRKKTKEKKTIDFAMHFLLTFTTAKTKKTKTMKQVVLWDCYCILFKTKTAEAFLSIFLEDETSRKKV